MFNTKALQVTTVTALAALTPQLALAAVEMDVALPGPGIIGLIVAGIMGAIALSRSSS